MNFATKVKLAIERHKYKKGRYKGQAPACPGKRRMNHFRLRMEGEDAIVTLYGTDIIRSSGEILTINTDGYFLSTYTIQAMRFAFNAYLAHLGLAVYSDNKFGKTQPIFVVNNTLYRYYDGIQVNEATKEIVTPLKPFQRKHLDLEQTTTVNKAVEESGFKAVFSLLHANSVDPPDATHFNWNYSLETRLSHAIHANRGNTFVSLLRTAVSDADHADTWQDIVACVSWIREWDWESRSHKFLKNSRTKSWNSLMRIIKSDMKVVSDTEVTSIKT